MFVDDGILLFHYFSLKSGGIGRNNKGILN